VLLLVEICLLSSSYKHFIFIIIIILFVCAVSVIGYLAVDTAHSNKNKERIERKKELFDY
jgi:hypothetical protein